MLCSRFECSMRRQLGKQENLGEMVFGFYEAEIFYFKSVINELNRCIDDTTFHAQHRDLSDNPSNYYYYEICDTISSVN